MNLFESYPRKSVNFLNFAPRLSTSRSNKRSVARSNDKDFVIPFVGLKPGNHTFEFDIADAFFESVEYSIIEKGSVKVRLDLEKKETMMIGEFTIDGMVDTSCDRCNDPVQVPIKGEYRTIFAFDDQPSNDENLMVIFPEEFELHLKDHLHELITVSLPSRTIHEEGDCNEEMIDLLDEYTGTYEETNENETDPRWDQLKKLKGNE